MFFKKRRGDVNYSLEIEVGPLRNLTHLEYVKFGHVEFEYESILSILHDTNDIKTSPILVIWLHAPVFPHSTRIIKVCSVILKDLVTSSPRKNLKIPSDAVIAHFLKFSLKSRIAIGTGTGIYSLWDKLQFEAIC